MEAQRDEVETAGWKKVMSRAATTQIRIQGLPWTGAIVARDSNYTGGIGRVISEPEGDGIAWVYWGTNDSGKFETREVVEDLVRLDLNDEFMKGYKRS